MYLSNLFSLSKEKENAASLYRYFETITDFNEIDDGKTHILLCHYPIIYRKRGYMIHGHIHQSRGQEYQLLKELPRVLNAGMDINFYRPVTLAELIDNNRAFYSGERDALTPPPPRTPRGDKGWPSATPDFRPIPERPKAKEK